MTNIRNINMLHAACKASNPAEAFGERAHVLVVDNEALLRLSASSVLVDAGFRASEAVDADAALALIEAAPHRFTHLFTDVHMPGTLDGLKLARLVSTLHSHIRVILTSADHTIVEDARESTAPPLSPSLGPMPT